LRRLLARSLLAAAIAVAFGILPLGLLARWAGDDVIAQLTNQTLSDRRRSVDFSLRAVEPGQDGSFIGFWIVCYLAHALFPTGSMLAATIAWGGGWIGFSVARCLAAVATLLLMFAYMFTVRVMYVRRQLTHPQMMDLHFGVYPIWALGAFIILSRRRARCLVALLVMILGASYWACTMMIWSVASRELTFTTVIVATLANNLIRILMIEVSLFVAVRLPSATEGAVTTLVALAVTLAVMVGHATTFCADSMLLLLLTQLIHFTVEVSRSYYLLKGQSDSDRVASALRAARSAASRWCAQACGSQHRLTPVMPSTEAPGPPTGASAGGAQATGGADAGSPGSAQWLRKRALADIISLTNVAEIVALVVMTVLLLLARARLGRLQAGLTLPLHYYVLTILACELITDFTIAAMSGRWSRSGGGAYCYESTVRVWEGAFASTLTQGCVICVVSLAAVDVACNVVEALCIIHEDPSGASSLGPCMASPLNLP